jgi:hypothetical protein
MTKKSAVFGAIVGVLLSGWAIWLVAAENRNPHGSLTGGKACASCHANDVPRVHTAEFVKKEHVTQAHLNWNACMTCHWQKSCNDCHEKKDSAPDYHTKTFKDVADKGRMEHVLYARARPEGCMVCHEHRYAATCGKCHQPNKTNG